MSVFIRGKGAIDQHNDPKGVLGAASETTRSPFDEIRVATCANRVSVISIEQYQA